MGEEGREGRGGTGAWGWEGGGSQCAAIYYRDVTVASSCKRDGRGTRGREGRVGSVGMGWGLPVGRDSWRKRGREGGSA